MIKPPNLSFDRAAGILLHISSLPGPWGIGDLGPEAENFLDFLKKSAQGTGSFCLWARPWRSTAIRPT